MEKRAWPKVSVVTPTLNSQKTLKSCLSSIKNQDYPGKIEMIIADGGSTDKTLKITQNYGAKIIKNPLKTGEAGKAVGLKKAKGTILAFIDSDNVLPDRQWLRKMISPFIEDREIIATEPLYFTYRRGDHWLTRYFALLGMGDPLNLFIGNYDRHSLISGKWTGLLLKTKRKKGYFLVYLNSQIPTIGANGFLVRRNILEKYPVKNYLFDIDVLKFLVKDDSIKIAKVKVGIVHLFSGNITTFIRKQRRRIRDYLYFRKVGIRAEEHDKLRIGQGIVKFTMACITVVPLLFQVLTGYSRKKDVAWLFHPLACWLTLFVYVFEFLRTPFVDREFDRKHWRQ